MRRAPSRQRARAFPMSVAVASGGAVLLVVGIAVEPHAAAMSYLVAYTATLAVVIGMLLLVMIAHLSGAVWFVLLRRYAESVVGALPALALFTLPLVILPQAFWPWAADARMPQPVHEALHSRQTYFHPAFFIARVVAYWAVWLGTGEMLRRLSRRQDAGSDRASSASFRAISAAGIPAVGLAATFAAVDWMMSIDPDWSSSVYGAYYGAGAMVSALAVLAIAAATAARRRPPTTAPTSQHFQALGRLTLAFLLLWTYLWYAQFFIVWIADIPRETQWYITRFRGGWDVVAAVVLVAGMVAPFLVLVFRAARGSSIVLPIVACCLLAAHYLDIYWLLVPSSPVPWSWIHVFWDGGALALLSGAAVAVGLWRHRGAPDVPLGDPLLDCSIRYQAH